MTTHAVSANPDLHRALAVSEQHPLPLSVALHLLPGLLIAIVFAISAPTVYQWGLPPFMALCLADLIVLVPGVLGFLIYLGYRRNGRLSFAGVVLFRERLPWWQYILLVALTLGAAGVMVGLLAPLGERIFDSFFAWLPAPLVAAPSLDAYPRPTLIGCYLVFFLVISVTAPIIEELYFRGYLLPRLERFGSWTPVIHAVLFALYHVWSPWLAIVRVFSVLPLVIIVRWKRSISVGIAAHILANSVDVVMAALYILNQV